MREAREVEGRESIRGDVRVGFGVLGKFEAKSHFYFHPALQTSSLQTTASEYFTFVAEDTDKSCCVAQVSINPRIPLLYLPTVRRMRQYKKSYDRKSMSCIAVLITQSQYSELELYTQHPSTMFCIEPSLTQTSQNTHYWSAR